MKPGGPALCRGTVWHRRSQPAAHAFDYPVSYVWFDPDRPADLTDLHPAWSTNRFRPVQIRRRDYGLAPTGSLSAQVHEALAGVVTGVEGGPVRTLTQARRWGWLFNPITIHLVWPTDHELTGRGPVAAVLEVTNTPWKQRHHYPLRLESMPATDGHTVLAVAFDKRLHVSPFLDQDFAYHLSLEDRDDRIQLTIDVVDRDGRTTLETGMNLERVAATRSELGRSVRADGLSTHRVSRGIHTQAARLLGKGVPFVPHPERTVNRGLT